jgi:transposase
MTKAYSKDFRKRVIEHYNNGATRNEVLSIFKIGANTLTRWIREYKETKSYSVKKREKYKERKIAKDYSVAPQAISSRFKVLDISCKKNIFISRMR